MINIKYVEWQESETHDCEYCGSYSGEGLEVSVNGNVVGAWENDGHMWGSITEGDIKEILIRAILEVMDEQPDEYAYYIEDGWFEDELWKIVVPDDIRYATDVLVAWLRYYDVELTVDFTHEYRQGDGNE